MLMSFRISQLVGQIPDFPAQNSSCNLMWQK